ncbi:MAG: hypothetical protein B7Z16_07975 [Algoriphagus sp. 32-45-6]|nr:MAG: hypothetical protein B7Z16_07975 [Algoriphagus sp. 32-45-6]
MAFDTGGFLSRKRGVKIWLAREFASEIRQILAEMRIKKSNCIENKVLPQKSTSLKLGSRPQAFGDFWPSKVAKGKISE